MNESRIAVRYSKALFLSAREQGLIKEVRKDMLLVLELSAMPDFREVLESPVIPGSKKKEVMAALFRENVSDTSFNLILLSVNNNREAYLPGIARSYIDRADEYEGITKVSLKSPVKLSKENRQTLIGIIERDLDTEADLTETVDEEVAGGYILKVEDLYIDASLKSQLRRIRKELIKE